MLDTSKLQEMKPSLYAYGLKLVDSMGKGTEETIRINVTRSIPLEESESEKVGPV